VRRSNGFPGRLDAIEGRIGEAEDAHQVSPVPVGVENHCVASRTIGVSHRHPVSQERRRVSGGTKVLVLLLSVQLLWRVE